MSNQQTTPQAGLMLLLVIRGVIGGTLMGLANLVPGISGGTMLVAAGVYTRFINALAELTSLKFRRESVLVFAVIALTAVVSIVLFAGPVKHLVVHHRWVMYSLFIGLTLGGLPVVWRLLPRVTTGVWVGAAGGFAAMAALALFQATGAGTGGDGDRGWVMMLFAGVAGASAMILPGVSGGYLLLVLGVYVGILGAIDTCKDAVRELLSTRDGAAAMATLADPVLHVVLPVGLGVVLGVVAVSHLLKWLLTRCEQPTLGVLLGLLLGAVVGLWPFQEGVPPMEGQMFKGRVMTVERIAEVKAEDYPTVYFRPTTGQVVGSFTLIFVGFAMTSAVAWIGGEKAVARGPVSKADSPASNP